MPLGCQKRQLKTDQKINQKIYVFWMDFGVVFGLLLDSKSNEKRTLIFLSFFVWILDDFWDVFWEPNRIKKSMEFRTPFLINFCWFFNNFWVDFGCVKWMAEIIFHVFQHCPYGANPGVKFSVRSKFGEGLGPSPPLSGHPFWAILVPLRSPNGAKALTKSTKNLIIF